MQETYARWYAMTPGTARRHRIPRRLADHRRQPHLPGPARLGPGPPRAVRRRMDPRAATRPHRADHRAARRLRPTRPTGSPWMSRSAWPSWSCSTTMTPAERVAFILHDVFGYPFADVAEITGRTPAACRQLASSARRRVRAAQAPAAPTARQAGLVRAFKQAWEAKDIGALIGLLDPGATVIADGGGLASAALHPIEGGEQVARYLADIASRALRQRDGPGAHGQRPARPGRPARRRHRDGVRVRGRRRPDHAYLGRPQPRQAPVLDGALTAFADARGRRSCATSGRAAGPPRSTGPDHPRPRSV